MEQDSPGEESDIESEREPGGWTAGELEVLRGALEEWLELDGTVEKKDGLRKIVKTLQEASPNIEEKGLNDRVKGWLKRMARPRLCYTGGKKPTLREVVGFTWAEKIKDRVGNDFGVLPGQKAFIGKRAVVLSDIMKTLTVKEKEGFERVALTWARRGPPKEKRRR